MNQVCVCVWGGGGLVDGYFSKSWTTRGERDVLVGGYFSKSWTRFVRGGGEVL